MPVFPRMFAITENNYSSKSFHGVEGRFVYETRFWLLSVTVFRYEGEVSQKNRSKFVKKNRVSLPNYLCFLMFSGELYGYFAKRFGITV